MSLKDIGPEVPSKQDLAAFGKEYFKSYMETIEEKKPQIYPKFAQDAPYQIQSCMLPNGCICMIFTQAKELKVEGGQKNWDQIQEIVVKGVDHFAGFYPFEGRSLGDWNKRGKRDALRDMRLMNKSEFDKIGAELEVMIDNMNRMVNLSPWLGKSGTEMVSTLRNLESRVTGGFPTVDAIANLQSMKTYAPGPDTVRIEFPDREILERITNELKETAELRGKLDMIDARILEVEKVASSMDSSIKFTDLADRVDRLEKQLEKVSNILTMINSKVETYFSKTAEKERQADLEKKIDDYTISAASHEEKILALEREAERLVEEMRKMTTRLDKDVHESRKRIARMEKHFVEFAQMIQE
ncbi:MAG TPA: hypothetical protein VGB78_00290 [Thermoplasmata archaeon]